MPQASWQTWGVGSLDSRGQERTGLPIENRTYTFEGLALMPLVLEVKVRCTRNCSLGVARGYRLEPVYCMEAVLLSASYKAPLAARTLHILFIFCQRFDRSNEL